MTTTPLQSVLVVDDSPDIHHLVTARLSSERITIQHAFNAEEGWRGARDHRPDLILLDLDMPDADGMTLCSQLKGDQDLVDIPVIFLTGNLDVAIKVQAFELGAVDYVTKPFDAVELKARVRAALRTKRYHDLLTTKAQIDALTGLWNRRYLDDQLAIEVSVLERRKCPLSLLMADIDHFKPINDTYGHPFGDAVIQGVAETFTKVSREGDVVCRYGGEEFAIILRNTDSADALIIAERLRQQIAMLEFTYGQKRLLVTASFGVVGSDELDDSAYISPEILIEAADRALYRAKTEGRNRVGTAPEQNK